MAMRHFEPDARRQWQRAVQRLFALDFWEAIALCTVLFALVAVTDYVTPAELNFTFMYVFVILLACWNLGPKWGFAYTALACVMQVTVLDQIKGEYISAMYFYLDMGNRLFTFLIVIALAVPLRTVYGREKTTARVDWLTRVPNRRAFKELLSLEIARHERTGAPFSVAYIDVDGFKLINDRFGHKKGDLLLCRVAEAVGRKLRKTDTVARFGSDEFTILFSASSLDTALPVMQRVRAELDTLHTETGPVTFSVGLAAFARPGLSPDEVIACCDSLMHRAKREGKKTIAYDQFVDANAKLSQSSAKAPNQP